MPIYTYGCPKCETEETQMRRIDQRDALFQHGCGEYLIREIDVPGAVWAPTSTGSNLK